METGTHHMEPRESWGDVSGEDWARLQTLLELVRREHQRTELSPERRDQLRERLFARLDKLEARRRRFRKLLTAASAAILAGLLLRFALRRAT